MNTIPRPEHPKPQFQRKGFENLNGEWSFEIDNSKSGKERNLFSADVSLSSKITVPFCPESKLSGVEHRDFIFGAWYKRSFEIKKERLDGRVFIHFGAVDYYATVYINGKEIGKHQGGYASFAFEITDYVREGENTVALFAEDDTRHPCVPRGKQCERYLSSGCSYTRTTGIWQTVWLEYTPKNYIKSFRIDADPESATAFLSLSLCGCGDLSVKAFFNGKEVGRAVRSGVSGGEKISLSLSEKHLWEVGDGKLYDLELKFGDDEAKSYFGLRSVSCDNGRLIINGKPHFMRLVLDQGFYPDGVYTAKDEQELIRDINLSLDMGFDGARLHEKVFEERFLYHCDRLGYIVWEEFPDWGLDITIPESIYSILPEWTEIIERDYNHPSIVGWCPHNETRRFTDKREYDMAINTVYRATKAIDPVRPCIDSSGGLHVESDIFDIHDYDQNPETFNKRYKRLITEGILEDPLSANEKYTGGAVFVSEYGGILFDGDESGWGYGETPKDAQEFISRFIGLADAMLSNKMISGLCYTQLTDVEQEQNGLYTFNREPKFPPEILSSPLKKKAAIEE